MNTFVIVGAGLFGITLAECLCKNNKVIIVEKRNVIGGNCYDYEDNETGITIHKYGPHILHIEDQEVLDYIKQFTEFNNYKHQVRTKYKNKIYEFPINLSTINSFYGLALTPSEVEDFLYQEAKKANINKPKNMAEKIISIVGEPLFTAFFKDYTFKQWGKDPYSLPESIVQRIPIKNNYDNGYYKKRFNGIPLFGYCKMFNKMLNSKNIELILNTDFFSDRDYFLSKGSVIYTGPIDRFFNFCHGNLEYRSIKFQEERHQICDFQGISVMNYPELCYDYTRICEPKHFYPERRKIFSQKKTIIYKEISFYDDNAEKYYPVRDYKNLKLLDKYINESRKIKNVFFGGRLGEYKYFDMEDTIKSAFSLYKKISEKQKF